MTSEMNSSEMPIPKPRIEVIAAFLITALIVFFVILAVGNLLNRVALISSSVWLLLVTGVIWSRCREEGVRKFLINLRGVFASKQFVESISGGTHPTEIRFGYQLLGHRHFYLRLRVDKIETVDWRFGQANWCVCLWFDHDDPAKSEKKQKWHVKPDQDIYIVGPCRRKEDTAALGHSFVDFLRQAGASLVRGEDECSFVRKGADTETDKQRASNKP